MFSPLSFLFLPSPCLLILVIFFLSIHLPRFLPNPFPTLPPSYVFRIFPIPVSFISSLPLFPRVLSLGSLFLPFILSFLPLPITHPPRLLLPFLPSPPPHSFSRPPSFLPYPLNPHPSPWPSSITRDSCTLLLMALFTCLHKSDKVVSGRPTDGIGGGGGAAAMERRGKRGTRWREEEEEVKGNRKGEVRGMGRSV